MKKLLLLLILCLMLCGCHPRGRQPSDDFVPPDAEQLPSGAENASRPPKPSSSSEPHPTAVGVDRVKVNLDEEGEYIYTRELIRFRYRVPYLDFPTMYAFQCNQEIEALVETPARESLEGMKQYEPPIVQTVDFTAYVFGDVLTVRLNRVDTDGSSISRCYSIHAVTGEAVMPETFLAAVGLEGQDPEHILSLAVKERFDQLYSATDPAYEGALNRTMGALSNPEQLNMSLTENGRLEVHVELASPAGIYVPEIIYLP